MMTCISTIAKHAAILTVLIPLLLQPCLSLRVHAATGDGQGNHHVILLQDRDYFDTLLKAIQDAQHEIVMAFFLFKTNGYPSNYPDRLLNELDRAAQRGIMIHVVLEGGRDATSSVDQDNRETAQRLRRAGIDVSFDSPRRTNHTKAVVIDRTYTFLGSHNLTNSALKYNHELSLFVHSPELSREILHYITMLRASAETR